MEDDDPGYTALVRQEIEIGKLHEMLGVCVSALDAVFRTSGFVNDNGHLDDVLCDLGLIPCPSTRGRRPSMSCRTSWTT